MTALLETRFEFHVCGERNYIIKSFLNGENLKLTTGKQQWDFTFIDDIVNAYVKLLNTFVAPGEHQIFNIGNSNPVSIRQIVKQIEKIIGVSINVDWGAIPHRENELWFICADVDKAKVLLNWQPKIKLVDGLKSTIEWYKVYF